MRIGITGTQGFVGGAVVKALNAVKHDVVDLDPVVRQGIFWQGQTEDQALPARLDWVLHFAATTSIADGWREPGNMYANNVGATICALEAARRSGASIVFMSSYVYGRPLYNPIDEKHPVSATNPYMGSKLAGEAIARQYSHLFSIPLVILRVFNVYGFCLIQGRLICDLIVAARNRRPFVLNDPGPQRDYLFIDDFVRLLLLIITRTPTPVGTYNVGSGTGHSNLMVAETFKNIMGGAFAIHVDHQPRRGDIDLCVADTSLVQSTFDWKPQWSLVEGVKAIVQRVNLIS